jgi:hypothetical protein
MHASAAMIPQNRPLDSLKTLYNWTGLMSVFMPAEGGPTLVSAIPAAA